MKRIALFTWYNGDCNFGQTLQAFALQKKIEQFGFDSIIIDYVYLGKELYHNHFVWPVYRLYDDLRCNRVIRRIKFDKFINKYMSISSRLFSYRAVERYLANKNIENFLLGSDQIWNPQAGNIPKVMLLSFNKGHKCSYSPSMCEEGDYAKYETEIKKISNAIREFDAVGVREENSKRMLERAGCDTKINVVLDPVFLLDEDEWKLLLDLKCKFNRYVLVYCLGSLTSEIINCVNNVKGDREVRYIHSQERKHYPSDWKRVNYVDPREYLSMIMGADYVIGDSFHMVAFSIIFKKQFFVFHSVRKAFAPNMDRVTDLLFRMGLLEQYNNTDSQKKLIDYCIFEDMIKKNIDDSLKHLLDILDIFGKYENE